MASGDRSANSNRTGGNHSITVGGVVVAPGSRQLLELPIARLTTGSWASLPVAVVHGREPGKRLWLDAAIHGDELNGMEIIRQVLQLITPEKLAGTVIAVPIVNVFGFLTRTRYLPDRRDLNRSFPGSREGSLAARLAHLFLREVVGRCEYGIDLHTGSLHNTNLPQIRANLADPEIRRCAEAFAAPLMFHAKTRAGSLRAAAGQQGKRILVYEAGEPMRFNRQAIDHGVQGVMRVLSALGMWREPVPPPAQPTIVASETRWTRARRSGILHLRVELGQRVKRNQVMGVISDVFLEEKHQIRASFDGLVIGHTKNPLINQGDALVHVARVAEPGT